MLPEWPSRLSVVIGIVVALLAVSCGGGGDEAAVPTAERLADTGEFTVHRASSAGFSIAVPRSWQSVSSDNLDQDKVDQLAEENPSMSAFIAGMLQPGTPIKMIAFGPDISDGFRTNLTVLVRKAAPGDTVEKLGSPERLRDVERAVAAVLRGPLESELVPLPVGRALKLSYEVEFQGLEGEPISVYQEQYQLISAGKNYALVFSTAFARKAEFQSVFAESAESFQIG